MGPPSYDFFVIPLSKLIPPCPHMPHVPPCTPPHTHTHTHSHTHTHTHTHNCDFLTCSIKNVVRKVKQFVRKYITWLIDLANKLYDVEKLLISFYAMRY